MKTITVSPSRRALTIRRRRSLRRTSTTAGLTTGPDYPRPARHRSGRRRPARVVHNRPRLWTAGCDGPPGPGPSGHDRPHRASPSRPLPAAQAPAAAAPVAPRCGDRRPGCSGWIRGPRSSSTTCRRRWPRCSTSWPRRRSGSVWWPGPCSAGARRDAAEELLAAAGRRRGARRRRRAATGRPGSARRRPSSWCGGGPLAAGIAAGLGTRRHRQRVDQADAGGAVQEGDLGTGSARRRPGPVRAARRSSDVVRRVAPGTSAGPPPARGRAGPVRARRRRRPRPDAASRRCTATGSRTCPSGCATASGSSGRWCCRAARRAWGASSCTGAAATPAGRPSRPSSSGDRGRGDAADGGGHRGAGRRPGAGGAGRRRRSRGGRARRCSAPRWSSTRRGRAAAPPVARAPGLHVWRTTARADMRAARRTGDNHEVMSAARPFEVSDIPRRTAARTAKLASLPLGVAGRAAAGWGRRLAGGNGDEISAQLMAESAEQLFAVLGELKGGAMKFGQALSVFEAAMPDELAGPVPRVADEAAARRAADADPRRPPDARRAVRPRLARAVPRVRRDARRGGQHRAGAPRGVARRARRSRSRSSTRAPRRRCARTCGSCRG